MKPFRGLARLACIAGVCLAVAGCITTPTSKDAQNFGVAINAALNTLNDGKNLQTELLLETEQTIHVCNYLSLRPYTIGSIPSGSKAQIINDQLVFLNALSRYAFAMQNVTEEEGIGKLKAASDSLAKSVQKLASSLPGAKSVASLAGPVSKLVINGLVDLSEARRRALIREIAKETHLFLLDGVVLVQRDEAAISNALTKQLLEWDQAQRCVLRKIRRSSGDANKAFIEKDNKKRNFEVRISNLAFGPKLMSDMLKAHQALFDEKVDFDVALDEFVEFLDLLQEIKQVASTN